jgi:hypothetical protein
MRDIRGDLQDRGNLLEGQINAARTQFDQLIEQLKGEHDNRLKDLKAELDAVNTLMGIEHRRFNGAPSAPKAQLQQSQPRQPQSQPRQPQSQPQPQQPQLQQLQLQRAKPPQPLSDFLIRKLSEVGAMSKDELRRLSVQEGYFADGDSAEPSVHASLRDVVKAGLIRQLPNGNFAQATVIDTIRLQRAI